MMKLRLLLFTKCNRSCDGCCNKDWDISAIPKVKDFTKYRLIMLTGGEPLLSFNCIINTIKKIREQTDAPIYLYTAAVDKHLRILAILGLVDGLTLTLHDKKDELDFTILNNMLLGTGIEKKVSLRLNIFKGINITDDLSLWNVKKDIEWIENCPLPEDEEFMKL